MTTAPRELLSAATIATLPSQTQMHRFNPNAMRSRKSLGDAVGVTHMGVHIVTVLASHDTTEYHRHWYE